MAGVTGCTRTTTGTATTHIIPLLIEPGVADGRSGRLVVCNGPDAGRTNALYGSNPIGFELQVTLWGYNRTDPMANVYSKSSPSSIRGLQRHPAGATITDMYVGQWSDPDEGDSGDDFAGCDTSLSVAYVYNAVRLTMRMRIWIEAACSRVRLSAGTDVSGVAD